MCIDICLRYMPYIYTIFYYIYIYIYLYYIYGLIYDDQQLFL